MCFIVLQCNFNYTIFKYDRIKFSLELENCWMVVLFTSVYNESVPKRETLDVIIGFLCHSHEILKKNKISSFQFIKSYYI